MNLKLVNTKTTILVLSFMMVDAGPALGATIALNGATGTSCSYTTYSADSSGNLQVACDNQQSQPGTPVCTLTASPSTISIGASSQLTATCSGSPTSYTWTGSDTANFTSSTSSGPVSPTSTTTYTVRGTNIAGLGNTASTTVTISSNNRGGDGTDWVVPTNCKIIPITWKGGLDLVSSSKTPLQHMPNGEMFAFSMKVPARAPGATPASTSYSAVSKYMSISKNACDFSETLGALTLGANTCMKGGRPNALIWNGQKGLDGSYCKLPDEGETVYFNVRNGTSPTSADSCPVGKDCTFYFSY